MIHGEGAQCTMRNRSAIIHEGFAFFGSEPFPQKRHAAFQFKGGCNPIMDLEFMGVVVHAVYMKIDKAGCDYQSTNIYYRLAREFVGRDFHDSVSSNAQVPNRIQASFGIHDAPAFQYEIIGRSGLTEKVANKEQARKAGKQTETAHHIFGFRLDNDFCFYHQIRQMKW